MKKMDLGSLYFRLEELREIYEIPGALETTEGNIVFYRTVKTLYDFLAKHLRSDNITLRKTAEEVVQNIRRRLIDLQMHLNEREQLVVPEGRVQFEQDLQDFFNLLHWLLHGEQGL